MNGPSTIDESRPIHHRLSAIPESHVSASAPASLEEDKFRALAESLPQMVFTCDANGKKTYCCRRYLDYTGCASFEEIDQNWLLIVHPEDRKAAEILWQQALEKGSAYVAEYRMRRKDGVYRHHLARANPTVNANGDITNWVGTITDVHDEKKSEELLRRTEKLAAAGRMAASLAHEINNPLASVTNAIYLALQDDELSSVTRQYLKLADRELSRVAQVTSHSLRFHKQSSAPRPVDLADLIDSVVTMYSARLQAVSISLDRRYRTREKLYCLADDLRQVFSHLLSNALDAMPKGGRLQIRLRLGHRWNVVRPSGFRITFADAGTGIAADFLPRVFDAFTSTKDPTGTGLGLWVAEGIVRKHDGVITIRSRTDSVHHGTVVSIFMPFLGAAD